MRGESVIVLLVAAVAATIALKLPPYFKPCSRTDPLFNECALKHGREAIPKVLEGDPKYRIPSFNPLKITEIRVENEGKVGINIALRDISIQGLQKVEVRSISADFDKQEIKVELFTPHLQILGQHNISGRVLILPITGHGAANITLENVPLSYTLDYKLETRKDGKQYIVPVKNSITFDTTQAYFNFENLFNGDKTLSDNMHRFVMANWREVVEDIGPSIADAIGQVIGQFFGNVANLVSYEEFFPKAD